MLRNNQRIWIARMMIGVVIFFNIQSAVSLLLQSEVYTASLGLDGVAGEVFLRGIGILFLMWNVPYLVAFWHPVRHHVSLYEAVCMQTIGLIGETILLINLPEGNTAIEMTLSRFITFDAGGLLLLLVSLWLIQVFRRPENAGLEGNVINI